MSLTDTGVMRVLADRMAYQGQRMAVLSQNVANADTPNYKARDLEAFTFENALSDANQMRVTNDKHLLPASMSGANASTKRARSFEVLPSGNSVDLEEQMMQVSKTAVDYQAFTSVYHKMMALFKTAVGTR